MDPFCESSQATAALFRKYRGCIPVMTIYNVPEKRVRAMPTR